MSYKVVKETRVFDGVRVRLDVHTIRDDAGREHTREVVVHGGAVLVLALDNNGDVLLIRVHRYPVGDALWELPAGTLEADDSDPAERARAELREETGRTCDTIEKLGEFFTSPGVLTERMHCYVARGLIDVGQQLEEGEDITVHPTPLPECLAMIDRGEIVDAKTIAALLMHARRAGG